MTYNIINYFWKHNSLTKVITIEKGKKYFRRYFNGEIDKILCLNKCEKREKSTFTKVACYCNWVD